MPGLAARRPVEVDAGHLLPLELMLGICSKKESFSGTCCKDHLQELPTETFLCGWPLCRTLRPFPCGNLTAMTAAVLVLAAVVLLCPPARAQPLPTSNQDAVTLMSFKGLFTNGATVLQSWASAEQDPCTSGWLGVGCQEVNNVSRVTEL